MGKTRKNETMFDKDKAQKYGESTDYIRGIIISVTTRIEFQITLILVNHFCKENVKDDFHRYFMSDSLTFEQKKYAFSSLRKSKKIKLQGDYKGIINDIDYCQKLRNLVAHSESYRNPEIVNNFNGKEIKLISFTSKKGDAIIRISLIDKIIENESESLFCINTFVDRSNRVVEVLKINTF